MGSLVVSYKNPTANGARLDPLASTLSMEACLLNTLLNHKQCFCTCWSSSSCDTHYSGFLYLFEHKQKLFCKFFFLAVNNE